jgi:hypothetical protein
MMNKRTNGNHGELQQALAEARSYDEVVERVQTIGFLSLQYPPHVQTWEDMCAYERSKLQFQQGEQAAQPQQNME